MAKKLFILAAVLAVSAVSIAFLSGKVYARIVGGPGTDAGCWGASGVEVCIDGSGNLVPTTTGVGSVGTSSLKFLGLNTSGAANIGGALTVTGTITSNGQMALLSQTTTQLAVLVPATTGAFVFNSTDVSVCVSSGVGAGAWINVSTASAFTQKACYP